MLTAPNEGLAQQLDDLLSTPISGRPAWYMILWTNDDLVITQATVWADLTEADFQGYGRWTLSRSGWLAATIANDAAVSTYGTDPLLWTPTGAAQTCYGYAIITPVAPAIKFIEPFSQPLTAVLGSQIGVLPQITLTTQMGMVGSGSPGRSRVIGRAAKGR